jgi:hypothetical protein
MSDIYEGEMYADGTGNLIAAEGDRAGDRVALHEGSYVFINDDEPSHNERYEQKVAEIVIDTSEREGEV